MPKKIPKIIKEIQKSTPPGVDYSYQKGISFSQMTIFNNCPHRWKLQYKDRIKVFTSSIHTVFGTAVHEAIQKYLDVMYSSSGAEADRLDLVEIFQEKFMDEYKKQYASNNKQHFSSAEEMREFFEDGVEILTWLKKKRSKYFSKRGWYLVGCEVPIVIQPNKMYNNVLYNGFLDVVMYHEPTNTFKILDIKTSTRGWGDKEKKDEIKQFQILLYKHYFSEQFGVPIENIDVKFFILKRKIWEQSEFPQKRIQEFTPANGKTKVKKAKTALTEFIENVFNMDGTFKTTEHTAQPDKSTCRYCPFKDRKDLCNEAVS